MHSNTTTAMTRGNRKMTEWGSKARKAEAKARKTTDRRAAIRDAKDNT